MAYPVKKLKHKIKSRDAKIKPKMRVSGRSVFLIKRTLDKKSKPVNSNKPENHWPKKAKIARYPLLIIRP